MKQLSSLQIFFVNMGIISCDDEDICSELFKSFNQPNLESFWLKITNKGTGFAEKALKSFIEAFQNLKKLEVLNTVTSGWRKANSKDLLELATIIIQTK